MNDAPHDTRTGIFHVNDFGAVADGHHDDTDAVLAAVKAAGNHGVVQFGRGLYRLTRRVVVPTDQTWRGLGIDDTGLAKRQAANAILTDVAEGHAIEAAYNTRFEHLHFKGSDRGTCMLARGRVRLDDINIQHYETAIRAVELWYGHFSGLRLHRNSVGIDIDHSYNLTLVEPRFNCVDAGDSPASGILCRNDVEVKVFGGSIENYRVGIGAQQQASVHVYSTYFESSPPRKDWGDDGGARAVSLVGSSRCAISLVGCYIYLHNTRFVVDASGADTDATILGLNNHIKGGNPLGEGPHHRVWEWTPGSKVRATLMGDRWDADFPENSSYCTPGAAPAGNSIVAPPPDSMPGAADEGLYTGADLVMAAGSSLVLGAHDGVPAMGKERREQVGRVVFHRPSRKPIVWNGQQWTFFDGAPVPLSAGDRVSSLASAASDIPLGPIPLALRRAKRFLRRQVAALKKRQG